MRMYGAEILEGLENWQILPQRNHQASVTIKGRYIKTKPGDYAKVYARIVREDTGENVVFWKEAVLEKEKCHWEILLEGIPKGGLYRLETCLKEEEETPYEWAVRGDCVKHFGVGDLFVIAGQSNAAGYGKDTAYDPPMLGVHLFSNQEHWELAAHPLNDSTKANCEVNMEPANSGTSPYLSFAKILCQRLGYPIGLIQTALGGSPLSRWNPEETGDLYENMLRRIRLQGQTVKGILWYQGCADTNHIQDADRYLERFEKMVTDLREKTHNPQLPFFTFQLSRYLVPPISREEDENWSKIREAQRQAAHRIPGVYVLPAIDGNLSDMIHNSGGFNLVLGDRLARQVLSKCYGVQKAFCDAPDLAGAELHGKDLTLTFAPVYDRLYASEIGAEELPFSVKEESGEIPVIGYEMTGRQEITLHLKREPKGKIVVCAYPGQNPRCRCLIDFATHYPILGFSQKLEKNERGGTT